MPSNSLLLFLEFYFQYFSVLGNFNLKLLAVFFDGYLVDLLAIFHLKFGFCYIAARYSSFNGLLDVVWKFINGDINFVIFIFLFLPISDYL